MTARAASLCLLLSLLAACRDASAPPPSAQASSAKPPAPVVGEAPLAPTYNDQIAPILYEHCATCHRPLNVAEAGKTGGAGKNGNPDDPICVAGAPFSVLDFRAVQPRAKAIATAVQRRAMPPWLPEPGHGDFLNERRLTAGQIALIELWASAGALEGDPAKKPPLPTFPDGWQLGKPDLVLTSARAYTLPAKSGESFRNFVLRVPQSSSRYVRAIEFRADNARVLHHANVGLDPARVARKLDRADAEPGFPNMPEDQVQDVFGWSPGKVPVMEPADTAWTLEEGSDLVVQLHMVASDRPETVRPAVGLFFASMPPTRVPVVVKLESKAIDIPAGQADYTVEDRYVLPADVEAVSVYPHAHYLAKEMRGTATRPDGTVQDLIWIKNWSVRWQDQYRYRTPISLPKGTALRMRFTYDNSAANPNNRFHPPRRVQWGPLSTDEMGALWLEVVPRRREDAALLARDYETRALNADLASAELKVRSHGDDAAARNRLATKYLQARRVEEALSQLKEALRLQPSDAEAHSNLGTVLQARGQVAEALVELQEAARLKPNDDRVRFNLGNGLFAAGRLDDAVRELSRAIALNPDNEDAHFNLAMIVGPRGQVDEAITHLRRVIELNPRHADAYRNLAVALGLQGRFDEAIARARTAQRLAPDSPQITQHLNQLLAAQAAARR